MKKLIILLLIFKTFSANSQSIKDNIRVQSSGQCPKDSIFKSIKIKDSTYSVKYVFEKCNDSKFTHEGHIHYPCVVSVFINGKNGKQRQIKHSFNSTISTDVCIEENPMINLLANFLDTSKPKTDTIPVLLLMIDTTTMEIKAENCYQVRNISEELVEKYYDPNRKTYHGNGSYSTTLLAVHYYTEKETTYSHLKYLDKNKNVIPKRYKIFLPQDIE